MTAVTEPASALQDPFHHDVPLPLRLKVFPLGFPVELATNSEAILAAADQSWGSFRMAYPEAPVSIHLAVTNDPDAQIPLRPQFHSHQHMMSIVSDARNQVICDFNRNCAFGWLTTQVAEDTEFLRLHFLEAAAMVVVVQAYLAPLHGGLVTKNGVGIALCGESFAGKSTLSYACARSGWTFIADDGTFLLRNREDRYAVGNPHSLRLREDARDLFPELADRRVALRMNGKWGMEVPTSELPFSTANGCSIDHMVFLRRSSGTSARLKTMDPQGALAWLEQSVLYGPAEAQASQRQAYRRLLGAGLWELHYSDLDEAIELLNQLGAKA